jgi:hypothetical protein
MFIIVYSYLVKLIGYQPQIYRAHSRKNGHNAVLRVMGGGRLAENNNRVHLNIMVNVNS